MNADDVAVLKPGDLFRGYVIKRCLGRGGSASVYLAHHEVLDAFFAIKILHPSVASDLDHDSLRRFLREARLAVRVRHPNLVAVHDCGHDEGSGLFYLVMDYVPGSSLRNMLAFEGVLSVEYAASVVAQVASALEAAKAFNLVHRDIKPENIMVQPDGRAKLVDLGIAKVRNLGDSFSTNTDSTFGTPSYISPEQAQCAADVDARADVYSLGIVFFEMLSGKCPYTGDNPAHVLAQILSDDPVPDVRDYSPGVRPEVAVLIRRMTVKDKVRRLSSLKVVLDELGRLGLGGAVVSLPTEAMLMQRQTEGMKTLLDGLDKVSGACGDPLEAPDEDVQAFLAKRAAGMKLESRRKAVAVVAVAVLLSSLLMVLLLFFL